jgi:hypothetical protein
MLAVRIVGDDVGVQKVSVMLQIEWDFEATAAVGGTPTAPLDSSRVSLLLLASAVRD